MPMSAGWDSQTNLLLVQLIYKYGDPFTTPDTDTAAIAAIFDEIAHQLTNHSLVRPTRRKFTGAACERHYVELLGKESLTRELSLPTTASANRKQTLAQRLYVAHLAALKSEIQTLETEFLSAHKDIEAIERGDWDDRFKQAKQPESPQPQKETEQPVEGPEVKEEEKIEEPVPPSKESTPVSASGVNKRTRAGRRKTESVTPGPAPAPVYEEKPDAVAEEVETVETPASKRARMEEDEAEPELQEVALPLEDEPMKDVVEPEAANEDEEVAAEEEQPGESPEEEPNDEGEKAEPAEEPMDLVKEEPPAEKEEEEEDDDEESPEDSVEEKQPSPPSETAKQKVKSQTPQPTRPETPLSDSDEDTTPSRPKQKPFSALIHTLHAGLSSLRSATLFSQPIREVDAPGYYSLIRKPVDLKTLWKQVKEGVITESVVFHREVARMFANAAMYNAENSTVWSMARDMADEADTLCEGYRKSENFGNGGGRIRKRK